MWFGVVEECNNAAVLARRFRRDDDIAGGPAGLDPIREFCLLEDSQIHVCLGHPPECRLQTSLAPVMNVVGAESNRHLPTRSPPGIVVHALPTVPRFLCPPARACLARSPFAPVCRPRCPVLTVIIAVPVPVPVPPVLSPPCCSPRQSPVVPYNLVQVAVFLKVTVAVSHGTMFHKIT